MEVIRSERTGEECVRIDHPSGLPILVWPKKGYQSAYAVFATRYGSIDTAFTTEQGPVTVPAGIAHYLEHKLFENEDCDAFERYARTGAVSYTHLDVYKRQSPACPGGRTWRRIQPSPACSSPPIRRRRPRRW